MQDRHALRVLDDTGTGGGEHLVINPEVDDIARAEVDFANAEILRAAIEVVDRPQGVHRELEAIIARPISDAELPIDNSDVLSMLIGEIDAAVDAAWEVAQRDMLLDERSRPGAGDTEGAVPLVGQERAQRRDEALRGFCAQRIRIGEAQVILLQQNRRQRNVGAIAPIRVVPGIRLIVGEDAPGLSLRAVGVPHGAALRLA